MAIDFPLSPAVDELYSNGERTWRWNSAAWQLESTGQQGEPGPAGADGLSAYEVAVANGFVGTEEEWLATLVGPEGPQGIDGVNGLSAYEVAVAGGFVGTEEEWLASLVGPQGAEGPMGTQGIGIRYVGTVATLAELPASATQGDLYIVQELDPDHGYVWDETLQDWVDAGPVQGPQGVQGPAGEAGTPGLSAYEVAVAGGFVGTEAEWLLSLEGADGAEGPAGPAGPTVVSADEGNAAVLGTDGFIYTPEGLKYTFSATAPTEAKSGDRWTDANSGLTYTFVDDGNSSQWVEF